MARRMLEIQELCEEFPFTRHQVYKLVRRVKSPLPHKKIGRNLYFDKDKIWKWFDMQPGKDIDDIGI